MKIKSVNNNFRDPFAAARVPLQRAGFCYSYLLYTVYWISFSSDFGSVATRADADLTMGGATYTKEAVLGRGLYSKGADTLTYVGDGTRTPAAPSSSSFVPVDEIFSAHAIAGPSAPNERAAWSPTGTHEYECVDERRPNGGDEYLSHAMHNDRYIYFPRPFFFFLFFPSSRKELTPEEEEDPLGRSTASSTGEVSGKKKKKTKRDFICDVYLKNYSAIILTMLQAISPRPCIARSVRDSRRECSIKQYAIPFRLLALSRVSFLFLFNHFNRIYIRSENCRWEKEKEKTVVSNAWFNFKNGNERKRSIGSGAL